MTYRARPVVLVLTLTLASACSGSTPPTPDAAVDSGTDAPATDVPMDVPVDVPVDATPVCPRPVEVLVVAGSDWQTVAQGFQSNPSPCADYYVSVAPQADDPTLLRGAAEPTRIRNLGVHMHALAVLDWGVFASVTGTTWYDKGTGFRRQVAEAGYNPVDGDTWLVVNVPVAPLGTADGRQALRDLMRGLYTGPMGSATVQGAVLLSGPAYAATDVTAYRVALQGLLADAAFWGDAGTYARWLGEVVPPVPEGVCVAGAGLDDRAAAINAYTEHLPRLASAMGAPASVATARGRTSRGRMCRWSTPNGIRPRSQPAPCRASFRPRSTRRGHGRTRTRTRAAGSGSTGRRRPWSPRRTRGLSSRRWRPRSMVPTTQEAGRHGWRARPFPRRGAPVR